MKFVCPDCGYEANEAGDCPECETPLLRDEGEVGEGEVEVKEDMVELKKSDDDEEW